MARRGAHAAFVDVFADRRLAAGALPTGFLVTARVAAVSGLGAPVVAFFTALEGAVAAVGVRSARGARGAAGTSGSAAAIGAGGGGGSPTRTAAAIATHACAAAAVAAGRFVSGHDGQFAIVGQFFFIGAKPVGARLVVDAVARVFALVT